LNIILPLFLGIFVASIGILPPGLINMTAVKISVKDGKNRAFMFLFGALIIIYFQTLVALIFARYIDSHKEIALLLREVGFVIFSLLTIYFFWIAKKPANNIQKDIKIKSKKSRFFLGMFISAINFFPIPYYVFMSVTLASFGYFSFDEISIYMFTSGVVFGSFLIFYLYITFFKNLETKTTFMSKNMNNIIGSITGFIAFTSLIYIVRNHFNI
jgi:threonine/homoserine/homoserine lactone efflux protein